MKQGDNVVIEVKIEQGKVRKKVGVFIKDYGSYIQILNRFGLRESIMQTDIKKIVVK